MQVQSAGGVWVDVHLGPRDLAILPGALLQRATGGMLSPAMHRVVCLLLGSSRRRSCQLCCESNHHLLKLWHGQDLRFDVMCPCTILVGCVGAVQCCQQSLIDSLNLTVSSYARMAGRETLVSHA